MMKRLQTFLYLIFTAAFNSIGSGQVPLDNPITLSSAASGTLRNGLVPELIASFDSYGLTVLAPARPRQGARICGNVLNSTLSILRTGKLNKGLTIAAAWRSFQMSTEKSDI